MSHRLPQLTLIRHGGTAWSKTGQHTGRTDLALTEEGEQEATAVKARLAAMSFDRILVSPLQRAVRTAELAGIDGRAERDGDLMEWNYGSYEGLRTAEIQEKRPGWNLFRDGCPGGESVDEVALRADRVIAKVRATPGSSAVVAHGHLLRVLAARWLALPGSGGALFTLGTVSVSILGYDHALDEPVISLWNDRSHLGSNFR